jgi:hypothetical protein
MAIHRGAQFINIAFNRRPDQLFIYAEILCRSLLVPRSVNSNGFEAGQDGSTEEISLFLLKVAMD